MTLYIRVLAGGVPPLGGSDDIRNVSSENWAGRIGVVLAGRVFGYGMDVANAGVHLEAAGYHF